MIVVFPDHTHLLFLFKRYFSGKFTSIIQYVQMYKGELKLI